MRSHIRKIPTLLIHGTKDALVTEKDFEYLIETLEDESSNKVVSPLKLIEIPLYGHNDYIWAKNSQKTTNEPILSFLKSLH
jgi:pimeloyl-ACP methyl ester carboxylesterase